MKRVNVSALKKVATCLRHGVPCEMPALFALETENSNAAEIIVSQMGGQNCHVDIIFEDGVTWLARFRLVNDPRFPPLQVSNYIFDSEIATMYDLANAEVRAPKNIPPCKEGRQRQSGGAHLLPHGKAFRENA